ncbi:hypothetical protein D3C73_1096550 [compost metagenome]
MSRGNGIAETVATAAAIVFQRPVFADSRQEQADLPLHRPAALPTSQSLQDRQEIGQV